MDETAWVNAIQNNMDAVDGFGCQIPGLERFCNKEIQPKPNVALNLFH
jgi:hypothetical protein